MKRKSPLFVKILACLLLLGSFAAFYPSWLKLSADVASPNLGPEPVRMSPGEIIQNFTGMDAAAVKNAAAVGMISSGVQMDTAVLNDLLDRTLDGHFNLPGLAFLCRDLGELCTAFQRPDVGQLLSKANLAVWVAFGLLILLGLVALVCQLTDHPAGILPYFLLGALMVVGLQLLRRELNGFLTEQSEALFAEFGIGELTSLLNIQIEVEMVKMGIGAYLCPFLALLAMLFSCIRKKQPKSKKRQPSPYPARRPTADPEEDRPNRPSENAASGWTCPNCGARLRDRQHFCDQCGERRPAPAAVFCPECGEELPAGATFCPECGARLGGRDPYSGEDERFRLPDDWGKT